MSHDQKRHADFFEAYIGAAWISASQTKDPEHVHEIEYYLSQLFKPRGWPALESLLNGSGGLMSAVRLEQALDSGSEDDGSGDISVIDVPTMKHGARKGKPTQYLRDGRMGKRGGKKMGSSRKDRIHVIASHRHHQKKQAFEPPTRPRMMPVADLPIGGESARSPIIL